MTISHYAKQRKRVQPPYVDLRSLRSVSGMTLDEVCAAANEADPELTLTRGALSAIENGHRGASTEVLRAIALAYGLDAEALDVQYRPRRRGAAV
ncbi:helix-turn-helix domain-containing protein [Auraticoccus monumenti]|uniref:Helix-turn-helix domain-containing protein n=1 Tax=Auraticoccus monumenti TaxID=675864 RepID=A0A1G6UQH6_9ACTN|nr:helix-turn-helix transcriptional regulator [Auraticoccus monumenti]SDD43549.1 Helix-turn-helix domain-containing protein [Auraticoccus monumenti]